MLVKTTKFFFICLLTAAISLSTKAALAKTSQLGLPMPFDTFTSVFLGSATSPISSAQSGTVNTKIEVGKVILEYLKVLAWPVVVACFINLFKSEISKVLESITNADTVKANVLGQTVEITKTDAREILEKVITEMKQIVNKITPDEHKKLKRIMEENSCFFDVKGIFPDFNREEPDKGLETLRKLRNAEFIRPENGGQWERDTKIEIKPFGQLMWDKVGTQKLFE